MPNNAFWDIYRKISEYSYFNLTTTPPFVDGGIDIMGLVESFSNEDQEVSDPLAFTRGIRVAIKAFDGSYVTAGEDTKNSLIANRTWVSDWETFEAFRLIDNKVGFRAANGKYVMANVEGDNRLLACASRISGWEAFEIHRTNDNKIYLRAFNGSFVTTNLPPIGNGELAADKDNVSGWETFDIEVLDPYL